MDYDRRGNRTRQEYLGFDGKPATNIEIRLMTSSYNTQNQLTERVWSYYQTGSNTLLGVMKAAYNGRSQKTDEAYFGPDGRPFLRQTDHGDCIRVRFVYDAAGNVTDRQCFDERGESRRRRQS
jgi:hypothetical protein